MAEVSLNINSELVESILTRFIRSEITRTGFHRTVLGLSLGVDSSVVCFLRFISANTVRTCIGHNGSPSMDPKVGGGSAALIIDPCYATVMTTISNDSQFNSISTISNNYPMPIVILA